MWTSEGYCVVISCGKHQTFLFISWCQNANLYGNMLMVWWYKIVTENGFINHQLSELNYWVDIATPINMIQTVNLMPGLLICDQTDLSIYNTVCTRGSSCFILKSLEHRSHFSYISLLKDNKRFYPYLPGLPNNLTLICQAYQTILPIFVSPTKQLYYICQASQAILPIFARLTSLAPPWYQWSSPDEYVK